MIPEPHAFLRSRRTIRRLKPDPVPQAVLRRVLETAVCAPSANNRQPWRFVLLTSPRWKSALAQALSGTFQISMQADGADQDQIAERIGRVNRRLDEAPAVIVLCRLAGPGLRPVDQAMDEQSVAMAGLQLLLAVRAEGLAANWICWPLLAPGETRQALELPEDWEPQGMVFIGRPDEDPPAPARKPLAEISLQR